MGQGEPTVAAIPGILLRTALRFVGRVLFAVAGVLLLCGFSVAFASLFVATWRTPRTHRTQLLASLLVAATQLVKEYR